MLRAQQTKLAQDVNDELVDIRQVEVDYFVQFFSAFGTQAALIAGAQFVALAEIRTEDSDNNVIYSYVFWLFNALTIGLALHVLLCSVYIAVYGQGLALRGPIGSMVRAVEGMVSEQEQVLTAFTVMMCSLSFGTMGAFFVQMDFNAACAACVILAGCMYLWYHYCLRIYNRFKFLPAHSRWDSRSKGSVDNPIRVQGSMRSGSEVELRSDNGSTTGNSNNTQKYSTNANHNSGNNGSVISNNIQRESDVRGSMSATAPRASFSENMRSSFSKLVGSSAGPGAGPGPPSITGSTYTPPSGPM